MNDKEREILNNFSCFLLGGERFRRTFKKSRGREESSGKPNGLASDILAKFETIFETSRIQAIHYHTRFQHYANCVWDEPLHILSWRYHLRSEDRRQFGQRIGHQFNVNCKGCIYGGLLCNFSVVWTSNNMCIIRSWFRYCSSNCWYICLHADESHMDNNWLDTLICGFQYIRIFCDATINDWRNIAI